MATITPTELATALDTDARTTRKFLRSITPKDAQPGKGSRWAIEKRDVRSLRSKFAKFLAAEEANRAEREANRAATAPVEDATAPANDSELDEPTDEMIAELEDEADEEN